MPELEGKTVLITGASRGIGKAIGLRCAREGANVVIAAKTAEPHPKLPGTVYTAAEEMEAAGGKALPVVTDIRFEDQVDALVRQAVEAFGGIDAVVNNASAIFLAGTLETPVKRYDLMHAVNARGTWLTTRAALPHLRKSQNPHILTLSPPLNIEPRWFGPHAAYTLSKYGMSFYTYGWAEEFRGEVAANALWPRTTIDTAATAMLGGEDMTRRCRTPEIMADAALAILRRPATEFTGNFVIDEEILREEGVVDFSRYRKEGVAEEDLLPDYFL